MTREVQLTKGYVALVDDQDYERVMQFHWQVAFSGPRKKPYATRRGRLKLHRFVMDAPPEFEVDHVDGNGLNCQRANMRLCTRTENNRNVGPRPDCKAGFKGVRYDTGKKNYRNRWMARITADGKRKVIGRFETAEDAARAYDAKARELHGDFCYQNFPVAAQTRGHISEARRLLVEAQKLGTGPLKETP